MKKRDSSLDCVAGILIIYMVLVHIFQWSRMNNILSSYWMQPLSFFMFWFFYKSGMFYKERKCIEILLGGGEIDDTFCCVWLGWTSVAVC